MPNPAPRSQAGPSTAPCGPAEILAMQLVPGVGNATAGLAMNWAANTGVPLKAMLGSSLRGLLRKCPAGAPRLAEAMAACSPAVQNRARSMLAACQAKGIRVVSRNDPQFPPLLASALGDGAPVSIYVLGDLSLLGHAAAGIVGSRAPAERGLGLASKCARLFAEAGITVVSGGARGIDSTAHEAALGTGGKTIIVLPQGLLTYPLPPLYREAVQANRAVIISEFVPTAPWQTHAAVTRNATISAFAAVLCVVDPRKTGGSLRTARHCLGQGKQVFFQRSKPRCNPFHRHPLAVPLLDAAGRPRAHELLAAWGQFSPEAQGEPALF